ncbi:MAG: tRNA 2-thiocytidine biosynthesis protein TtcA [Clostridia bacterium]|nr:tRNA 2-thiocytidine biosynthesis protein TtcA [Clostridia bacterium]
MERHIEIERSIIKKYRKSIWNRFVMGIKDYQLINSGDKIAVCISGGKDSMLMAKCIQHLQKYSDVPFEVEYIVMDPGYNPENRQRIIDNAKTLDIPIKIFDSPIFDVVSNVGGSPCYLCARMRRGYLYKQAQSLGCNKIALGHHFDDVIETILMSMLYAAEIKTMMPKLHSTNYEGMELIRPLYMVKEEDIIAWSKYNNLEFIRCACKFTEACANDEMDSKRLEMKQLIKDMKKVNKNVDINIFRSIHNVNLATVIGHKKCDGDEVHSFLETY